MININCNLWQPVRFLRFFLLLVSFNYAFAQPDADKEKSISDSLERLHYVTTARQKLTIFVFGSRFSNGILYSGNRNLLYYPIAPINIGLGFTHKWLGASVTIVGAEVNKGKFEGNYNLNFQINAYSRRVGADLVYTLNKGYYGANYKSFLDIKGVGTDRPYYNVRMERITINAVRMFNGQKYSLNAPIVQGEVQEKTAHSFLINAALSAAFSRNGDSLFVPSSLLSLFEDNTVIRKGDFYSFAVMPGYGVTWVVRKRFYIGIVPSAGPSFQFHHLVTNKKEENYVAVSYKLLGRMGLGYQSERWNCGLAVLIDAERYPLRNNTYLLNNVGKIYLRIGYKFNVPKWAKKYSDLMDKFQGRVEENLPKSWR